MTELCADYQISRKTGYKWVERFETAGPLGLQDQPRRPAHSPFATAPALVERLVALRLRHPRWGAKKLLAVARRRDRGAAWPSRSTVCDPSRRVVGRPATAPRPAMAWSGLAAAPDSDRE